MRRLRGAVASRTGAAGRTDEGSVLAITLAFLMVFGLWIGTVLQLGATGQRTTLTVRDEATTTYAGGGALEGAVNAVRGTLSAGSAAVGASTCFTLPAGALDNPTVVSVTCTPRTGSGAALGGSSTSQPSQAVLALSGNATEGVAVGAATSLPVQGDLLAKSALTVPSTATLTSTGTVKAGSCTLAVGTVTPACATAGGAADPGWAGPDTSSTTLVGTLPACSGPLVTLSPGIYRSASALQAVLGCTSAVVWFRPGTYYFDFKDAGTHQVSVGTGAVVVGGTPSGWTPGTTAPASVPYPTAAAPGTSACDTSAAGVDLAFGGDSRVSVTGGRVQMCALSTSTSAQHIVLRGLMATTNVTSTAAPAPTAASSAGQPAQAWGWDTDTKGAVIDGVTAHVKIPNTNKPPSQLAWTGFGSAIVPSDATNVSVLATVTETVTGSGNTSLALTPGSGTTPGSLPLHDCPAASPCPGGGFDPTQSDTATFSGLTAAQVNGMVLTLIVSNPNNSPVEVWVDGVTVSVTYTLPVAAVSGTAVATPYTGAAGPTALLAATGSTAVLALHGTVYAPGSVLDLGLTGVPYTVVDRGVVVRHLRSTMTPAAGYTGPLVAVPPLGQAPRRVLMTAVDAGGTTLARADLTFADSTGAVNGTQPTVREWSAG